MASMLQTMKGWAERVLNMMPSRLVTEVEFRTQKFTRFNERPVEFAFLFRHLAALYPRTILDVGTGMTSLPHVIRHCGPLVTSSDNITDYWPQGMSNRHYFVIDDDITDSRIEARFDLITCISVLEHIERCDEAIDNMFRLLKPGGHLILTTPHSPHKYVHNVYRLKGSAYGQNAPYITQSFSDKEIEGWLNRNGATLVDTEFWRFWDGKYWTVGNQIIPPAITERHEEHQIACMLFRK